MLPNKKPFLTYNRCTYVNKSRSEVFWLRVIWSWGTRIYSMHSQASDYGLNSSCETFFQFLTISTTSRLIYRHNYSYNLTSVQPTVTNRPTKLNPETEVVNTTTSSSVSKLASESITLLLGRRLSYPGIEPVYPVLEALHQRETKHKMTVT